jgi:hypothetical protein
MKNEMKGGFAIPTSNYKFFVIGILLIIVGFTLMSGGASDDPNVFNEEVFSTTRITIAPIVVLLGFFVNGFAIMYRPKN